MTDLAYDASWLTPAPPNWRVTRLAYVSSAIQTGPFGSQLHAEDYVDAGVPLINPSHIRDGQLLPNPEDSISEPTAQRLSRHRMRAGDVVFGRRGELGRCAVVRAEHQGWLCGTGSMVVRPIASNIDSEYLQLAASLSGAREWLQLQSVGSTMDNLNASILGRLPVPLPALDIQRRIVRALRRRTVAIDALIAKKERLIELLQEKRQALITQAVTKGLDPNVPTKKSGVEWLGSVPAHWSVQELRHRIRRIEQGWSPSCENREADKGEWGVLKVGCVNYGRFRDTENKALPHDLAPLPELEVRPGDVLVSRANTRELVGSAAFVATTQPRLLLCDKLFRLRYRGDTDARFLVLLLQSGVCRFQFEREATGASGSMQNIGQDSVRRLVFGWAPIEEQRRIVATVEEQTRRIDKLRDTVSVHLDKLREYRHALITAGVTGKLDVSKEAA